MKRRARLRRRSDFQAAIAGRRFHQGRALVGFAIPKEEGDLRVGVTVSRTVRSAIDRNRARRRLREVARRNLLGADSPVRQVGIRYDVVLVALRRVLEISFAELNAEMSQAAFRLAQIDAATNS